MLASSRTSRFAGIQFFDCPGGQRSPEALAEGLIAIGAAVISSSRLCRRFLAAIECRRKTL
jgi:hypothetical protein